MDRPADRHHAPRDVEGRRVAAVEPVVREFVASPGALVLEHAPHPFGTVALPARGSTTDPAPGVAGRSDDDCCCVLTAFR